jgi:hypothetical protein
MSFFHEDIYGAAGLNFFQVNEKKGQGAKSKGQGARGKGQRAKSKGQRARGKGQRELSKSDLLDARKQIL